MGNGLWLVATTALLSAACTAGLAYALYALRLRRLLEQRLAELADTLEERVRKGVRDAGLELLPAFREKVTEGFTEALAGLPQQGVSSLARTGASLAGEALSTLFGARREDEERRR